mgnify:FL=1
MIRETHHDTGLKDQQVENIQKVFSKYDHVDEVLIYGSRALGNYKIASDIDLALKGETLDSTDEMKITFDLDDLMLPYKFDITIYDQVKNKELRNHIDKFGKMIYKKQSTQL